MKILVPLFTALIAAGAFIRIAIPPVPVTLQTLFLFIALMLLEPRHAAYSVILYMILGIIGLPVFTTGGGIAAAIGPTGGYLWGMIPAAFVGSLIASRGRGKILWSVLAALVADIVLYIPGVLWLMHSTQITLGKALMGGLVPFIPGDALKIVIAALASKALWKECNALQERAKAREARE